MVSIKSLRERAHGLGSAKSGTRNFWLQRVISMLGLPLAVGLIIVIASTSGLDYPAVYRPSFVSRLSRCFYCWRL